MAVPDSDGSCNPPPPLVTAGAAGPCAPITPACHPINTRNNFLSPLTDPMGSGDFREVASESASECIDTMLQSGVYNVTAQQPHLRGQDSRYLQPDLLPLVDAIGLSYYTC